MTKYVIAIEATASYYCTVEAETPEDAEEIFWTEYGAPTTNHTNDFDLGEWEVTDIQEED